MKKLIALLMCVLIAATVFAGCGSADVFGADGIKVVTTIFPIYDWAREVSEGADINLTLLLDNGVDIHSYQPTAKDIMEISECDLFIYVGGESDAWVDDVLAQAGNDKMVVLDLLDILGDSAKQEVVVEGMQEEDKEVKDDDEEPEYDEHVWLSLKNAGLFTKEICSALSSVDHDNAKLYESNAKSYAEDLKALDDKYTGAVKAGSTKTLLFGDRFPFAYLADDYGLTYYAAFTGCSAETEASFETITFLANKVDELGLHAIMQIETSDGSIAATVRDNTKTKDQEILTLNSIQSVTAPQIEAGETYLGIMEENLVVLAKALA